MATTVKYLKHIWLKNAGAQDEILRTKLDTDIVVHSNGHKGRLWTSMDPVSFLELLTSDKCLYEVLSDFPQKVYFDIDLPEAEPEFFLDTIRDIIAQFFPNSTMAISGSRTSDKTSYHIVLQNYLIQNTEDVSTMKLIVKNMSSINSAFDWKVYTKNRQMKCVNQSKQDGRVQQIIFNDDVRAHCISCFFTASVYETIMPIVPEPFREHLEIVKCKEPFDITSLTNLDLKYTIDKNYLDLTPLDIISLLPINGTCDHTYTFLVARFCFYNGLSKDIFLQWIKHKHDERNSDWPKIVDKWNTHWSRLDRFPEVSITTIRPILQWYYPAIRKDRHFKKFEDTFNIDAYPNIKIDRLSQTEFFNPEKYKIFNIGMGGGKTAQTVDYLSTTSNFVWIAPNRALAYNTFSRLQEANLTVTYYSSIPTKDKQDGALNRQENLLIVANSLHYVTTRRFHDVVIDEIETLIDKWFGTFMKFKKQNWETFKRILFHATKVFLLDAFITTKTLNLIKAIDPSGTLCIYARILEPITRTVTYMSSHTILIKNIIDDLKAGLKLFIFYPYKDASLMANTPSMDSLYNILCKETSRSGIYYNADIDEPIKAGLRNVNDAWKEVSFIITNSVITCGVNYDKLDFDKEYLMVSSFSVPRDIIQVSYRPRHLTTGCINIAYLGKMTQYSSWETDLLEINCPIYTNMITSILTEKQSPMKKTIELFCSKAHYAQRTDTNKLSEETEREIIELLSSYAAPYRNIPDIDFSFEKPLQEKIFCGTATMIDKLTLKKYFFKKLFLPDAGSDPSFSENIIDSMWNHKYISFAEQYIKHLRNPNSVFKKIKLLNKMQTIFSLNPVHKIKLSEEIRTQIFDEFKFKYLHKKSATSLILFELYNTYFCTRIINKRSTSDKNVTYVVDDLDLTQVYTIYETFITKHLKNYTIDDDTHSEIDSIIYDEPNSIHHIGLKCSICHVPRDDGIDCPSCTLMKSSIKPPILKTSFFK